MANRSFPNPAAGHQFVITSEPNGVSLRCEPWGGSTGNPTTFGLGRQHMAWLFENLGEWARANLKPDEVKHLATLFVEGSPQAD